MQDVIQELVKSVLVASVGLLGPIVVGIVVQIFRKINIELSEAQEAKVRAIVQNVLLEVEEWASHRIKAQAVVTSGQKLERAIEAIVDKVPGISEPEAARLVREELPKVGLGAVHFLANAVDAATQP